MNIFFHKISTWIQKPIVRAVCLCFVVFTAYACIFPPTYQGLVPPPYAHEGKAGISGLYISFMTNPIWKIFGSTEGSPLMLYENDTPLAPANTLHETIRKNGNGAFSHWEQVIYFSASDGSDVMTNGKIYRFETTLQPRAWVLAVGVACFSLLIFSFFAQKIYYILHWRPQRYTYTLGKNNYIFFSTFFIIFFYFYLQFPAQFTYTDEADCDTLAIELLSYIYEFPNKPMVSLGATPYFYFHTVAEAIILSINVLFTNILTIVGINIDHTLPNLYSKLIFTRYIFHALLYSLFISLLFSYLHSMTNTYISLLTCIIFFSISQINNIGFLRIDHVIIPAMLLTFFCSVLLTSNIIFKRVTTS